MFSIHDGQGTVFKQTKKQPQTPLFRKLKHVVNKSWNTGIQLTTTSGIGFLTK